MTLLDSMMSILDAETVNRLGDPVIYTRAALPAAPLSLNTFVDHSDEVDATLGGSVIRADVTVAVRVADVAQPAIGDTLFIPARNETRKVKSWARDSSGRWWNLQTGKN